MSHSYQLMRDKGWARRVATGLSSFGSSLLRSLAGSRVNPSRGRAHDYEPVDMESDLIDVRSGAVISRCVRHAKICTVCGATSVIGYLPCIPGKYFD